MQYEEEIGLQFKTTINYDYIKVWQLLRQHPSWHLWQIHNIMSQRLRPTLHYHWRLGVYSKSRKSVLSSIWLCSSAVHHRQEPAFSLGHSPCLHTWLLTLTMQPNTAPACSIMVSSGMESWVGWPTAERLPTEWSPVKHGCKVKKNIKNTCTGCHKITNVQWSSWCDQKLAAYIFCSILGNGFGNQIKFYIVIIYEHDVTQPGTWNTRCKLMTKHS